VDPSSQDPTIVGGEPGAEYQSGMGEVAATLRSIREVLERSTGLSATYKTVAAERSVTISDLIRQNERLVADRRSALGKVALTEATVEDLKIKEVRARRQLKQRETELKTASAEARRLVAQRRDAEATLDSLASRRSVRAALRLASILGAVRPNADRAGPKGIR